MKNITKRTFKYLILLVITAFVGTVLCLLDVDRRSVKLNDRNITISLSTNKWSKNDIELYIKYNRHRYHIKEYSYDGGKTWTKSNILKVSENKLYDIAIKDVNNNIYNTQYNVTNIDKEPPIILISDNIQISRNSVVDLRNYVTAYDEKSGIREDITIMPPTINTRKLGTFEFSVYAIDKMANKEIKTMKVEIVEKAPAVLAKLVALDRKNIMLGEGEEDLLTANVFPKATTNKTVVWKSLDPNVATVDNNGKVIGVSAGSTTIVASSVNGIKDTCTVIVK